MILYIKLNMIAPFSPPIVFYKQRLQILLCRTTNHVLEYDEDAVIFFLYCLKYIFFF